MIMWFVMSFVDLTAITAFSFKLYFFCIAFLVSKVPL